MLEVKTLEETPVPDPSTIPITDLKKLIDLVNIRMKKNTVEGIQIDRQIDKIICGLYNLSLSEQEMLGITS